MYCSRGNLSSHGTVFSWRNVMWRLKASAYNGRAAIYSNMSCPLPTEKVHAGFLGSSGSLCLIDSRYAGNARVNGASISTLQQSDQMAAKSAKGAALRDEKGVLEPRASQSLGPFAGSKLRPVYLLNHIVGPSEPQKSQQRMTPLKENQRQNRSPKPATAKSQSVVLQEVIKLPVVESDKPKSIKPQSKNSSSTLDKASPGKVNQKRSPKDKTSLEFSLHQSP